MAARELKAAKADAEAKLTEAEAERKVVEARTKAEADVLKQEVAAYGGECDYVRAKLYEKTAPKLRDVITADAPGDIFGLPIKASSPPPESRPPRPPVQPAKPSAQQKGGAK